LKAPKDKLEISSLEPIDRRGPVPHYRQIAEKIGNGLRGLPPGTSVPSETEIVRWFGVSRGTAVRALQELEQRQEVVRVKGLGTFKARESPLQVARRLDEAKLPSFTDDLRREGFETGEEVHESSPVSADGEIAGWLELEEGETVWKISRSIFADDHPIVHVTSHLRRDLYPEIDVEKVSKLSLYGHLEARYGSDGRPSWAREVYFAGDAPAWLSPRLGVEEGSPVLCLERVAYLGDGRPAEYALSYMHGEYYRVEVTVMPGLGHHSVDKSKLLRDGSWSL
jgi:DNA-binding GntR family transcriptional regulator